MSPDFAVDALSVSVERVIAERDLAQCKLQIAVIALRQFARLEGDMYEPVRTHARAALLDLGEGWE